MTKKCTMRRCRIILDKCAYSLKLSTNMPSIWKLCRIINVFSLMVGANSLLLWRTNLFMNQFDLHKNTLVFSKYKLTIWLSIYAFRRIKQILIVCYADTYYLFLFIYVFLFALITLLSPHEEYVGTYQLALLFPHDNNSAILLNFSQALLHYMTRRRFL